MSGKRKSTKSGLIAIIAVMLVAVLLATYIGVSLSRDSWDPAKWVTQEESEQETPETPNETDETADGGMIVETVDVPLQPNTPKLSLMTTSLSANPDNEITSYSETEPSTSYTITATLTPSNLTLQDVTWSMSMSGYTAENYISLSSTTAKQITVTCIQAFPAQITLTCTWNYDSSIKASCKLDYLQRLNNFSVTSTCNGTSSDLMIASATSSYGLTSSSDSLVNFTPSYTYGTGTVKGTLAIKSVTLTISEYFQQCIRYSSYYNTVASSVSSYGTLTVNTEITPVSTSYGYLFSYKNFYTFPGSSEASWATNTTAVEAAKAAVVNGAKQYDGESYITVEYTYTYGTAEMTYTDEIAITTLDYSLISVMSAESINLSETTFLF